MPEKRRIDLRFPGAGEGLPENQRKDVLEKFAKAFEQGEEISDLAGTAESRPPATVLREPHAQTAEAKGLKFSAGVNGLAPEMAEKILSEPKKSNLAELEKALLASHKKQKH